MSSGELSQITALIKSGNRAEAKQRLDIPLKANPNSAQLWYLVAATMEGKQKQIAALNKALECDPTYEKAKIALDKISSVAAIKASSPKKKRASPIVVALRVIVTVIVGVILTFAAISLIANRPKPIDQMALAKAQGGITAACYIKYGISQALCAERIARQLQDAPSKQSEFIRCYQLWGEDIPSGKYDSYSDLLLTCVRNAGVYLME